MVKIMEIQPEFEDMQVPIDKQGANSFLNQNSREPATEPDAMVPLWKILHLVGADWNNDLKFFKEWRNVTMKLAIPLANGKLAAHFGHCHVFALIQVAENEITDKQILIPLPHEPCALPGWLDHLGADVIIAGGMGQLAIGMFSEKGIKVITGAPELKPEELVSSYLDNTLMTGSNVCENYSAAYKKFEKY